MDKIKLKMTIIKITFIVGIILDGLLGIDMFLYSFFGISIYLQVQNIPISSTDTQPVMMLGTALMLGWTVLLIWGLKEPIERKGMLIITAFPVVFLYIVYDIFQYLTIVRNISLVITLIIRCCLVCLLITSYVLASEIGKK